MPPRYLIALLAIGLLAIGLLAGCHADMPDVTIANGAITLRHNEVQLRVSGAKDAAITANGDLKIDGQTVPVDPASREYLQQYHRAVTDVRAHGIATGKAGMAVAGHAITSVAKGLANGDTDNIGKEVDAQADNVQQQALKICGDLASIKAAQDRLAAQLPAFQRYGGILDADAVADCRKNNTED